MITADYNSIGYSDKSRLFLNSCYAASHTNTSRCCTNHTHFLSLQEVIGKILTSRKVTGIDFNLLSLALRSESLDDEDKNSVHRVFYGLRRGWLTLIDISDEQLNSIKHWLEHNLFAKV